MPLIALEIEHRIDDMLQQPGAGNRPFFRHMPDNEDRHARPFRERHELAGDFLHLADTAGS